MNYLNFRKEFYPLVCFSINQIYAWKESFDKNNLTRWIKKGLIIRLKQGYYSFPEYKNKPAYSYYIANRIYKPSYISLHTALSYYGIIPEAIVQITSVTPLKTAYYSNNIAAFSYKTIKNSLMFGYKLEEAPDNLSIRIATPEKALLDLLYLYPFYNNEQEMISLRLDENFLPEELDIKKMIEFSVRFNSKALNERVKLLLKSYDL